MLLILEESLLSLKNPSELFYRGEILECHYLSGLISSYFTKTEEGTFLNFGYSYVVFWLIHLVVYSLRYRSKDSVKPRKEDERIETINEAKLLLLTTFKFKKKKKLKHKNKHLITLKVSFLTLKILNIFGGQI